MGSLGFELTEDEVNLLAMKYCDLGNKFEMNYWDFCDTSRRALALGVISSKQIQIHQL